MRKSGQTKSFNKFIIFDERPTMIICPFCQTSHVDNTLFCDECGTYLLDEETRDTFPLIEDETESAAAANANVPHEKTGAKPYAHTPPTVVLTLDSPKKQLEISLEKTIGLTQAAWGWKDYVIEPAYSCQVDFV